MLFYRGRPPLGNQTLSYSEAPYLPSFSSVLILDKSAQPSSSASIKFLHSRWNTLCQSRTESKISAEKDSDGISAKSPVLKTFVRIHFLMGLMNLLRSAETTAGWLAALQRWPWISECEETLCVTPQIVPFLTLTSQRKSQCLPQFVPHYDKMTIFIFLKVKYLTVWLQFWRY